MVAITVTIPTGIGNRYRTKVRPSIVTVRTSKSEVALIKSSNVTLPLRASLRVAIQSPWRTFTSMPTIIFGSRTPLTRVISIVPPAQPRRAISKRRWRRRAGPRWLVRRAPRQAISLIRSDLSFGANSLPEDLPFGPPVSEARTARPAWANYSPDTHIRQGAAARLAAMCEAPYPLRRRSRATTACGAATPAGGSNASPGRTR